MQRLHLDEDIKPLSEFRANAAALVQSIRETKRPLVLTQRGRSTAVVLDVAEYERLLEELELARDVRIAESQLAEGQGLGHEEARDRVLARLAS
jgi:prevent-host-death family protein